MIPGVGVLPLTSVDISKEPGHFGRVKKSLRRTPRYYEARTSRFQTFFEQIPEEVRKAFASQLSSRDEIKMYLGSNGADIAYLIDHGLAFWTPYGALHVPMQTKPMPKRLIGNVHNALWEWAYKLSPPPLPPVKPVAPEPIKLNEEELKELFPPLSESESDEEIQYKRKKQCKGLVNTIAVSRALLNDDAVRKRLHDELVESTPLDTSRPHYAFYGGYFAHSNKPYPYSHEVSYVAHGDPCETVIVKRYLSGYNDSMVADPRWVDIREERIRNVEQYRPDLIKQIGK